jgi:chloramphenicol 3-O-phosphotransferase
MADRAYGLAESAVISLAERIPGGDLAPLIDSLAQGKEFASAVHAVTGRELSRFESDWQQETRKRFRGVLWFIAGGWWSLVGVVVVVAWILRRRRERPRRAALDIGWELPPEEEALREPGSDPPPPIDQGPQGV